MVESVVQSHAEIVVGSAEKLIRVLHVDDELGLLKVAKQCLELQGPFQVDTAGSVEEALNKLKEKDYDTVVSDYQMPGKDGLQFLEILRKEGNATPFIMFTGRGREEIAIKALNLGADQYLSKTGDPETVYGELAHCIILASERKRARAALAESEEKLRTLFEKTLSPVLVVNENGEYVDANQAALDFLECSKTELISRSIWDFAPPTIMEKQRREHTLFLKPRTVEMDHLINGKVKTLWLNMVPVKTTKGILLYGIGHEVTEDRRIEKAIWETRKTQETLRKTGIDSVGDVSWGTHICQFYETKQDLIDVLVSYFAEGLRNNEFCMWITSEPLSEKEAKEAMKEAVPNFDEYNRKGQIEILPCTEWYTRDGAFDLQMVLNAWIQKLDEALANGYEGMRITGNTSWLEKKSWKDFTEYERRINEAIGKHRLIAICTYSLDKCGVAEIIDVVSNHQFALIKRGGAWEIIEASKAKQDREALKRTQMRLQKLFDASPHAMIITGLDGNIVECSQATLKLYGYESKDEIVGKNVSMLISEEDWNKTSRCLRESLNEAPRNIRCLLSTKDGRVFPAEVSTAAIKDSQGDSAGCIITVQDITERKKSEDPLRESEERFRSLFESIQDPVGIFVGREGRLIDYNAAFRKLSGYTDEELRGKVFLDLVHPDDHAMVLERYRTEYSEDKFPLIYEIRGVNKKGESIPLELSVSPYKKKGKVIGIEVIHRDLTERKKIERALKESEEKFRGLVELAPDGIISVNLKGKVTSTNRSFLKLVGYDSEEEIVGRPFTELVTMRTEDVPRFQGMFKSLMNGESPSPSEFLYVRRDGTSRWAEVHPGLMIKDGCPVGVQAIVRDVSERKNAEKLVQESHQKFEGLFRHNPEAAVYLDVNFKIMDVNPRFCQLFGYSAEEVKGRNINEVVAPKDMREEAESLDKDAKNGYASHDTVRKRKDGSFVPVSISACPVTFENNLLGYVGIYKDITDLKRAQEESEESRKHFQMLFDLMADPVAVVDGRGKILEVTRKVEEITGFKKEELVGKNLLKVEMFGAKTKAVMIKSLAKRMIGMHVEPYEVEVLKKDGGKLLYEINAAKIDYKGKPADLVVFRDILERKKLEEKLRIVGSLTRHDVRNKLSAITGNIYINKKKLADRPDVLEGFNDMQAACEQIVGIFEFARDYERLGIEELSFVDVETTVGKAASSFSDLKGARIVNECRGLTVLADSLLE